jgi:formylglycine-generating enzyme required for sulfatase activity
LVCALVASCAIDLTGTGPTTTPEEDATAVPDVVTPDRFVPTDGPPLEADVPDANDASVEAGEPCPGDAGPTMVRAGSFCIDSTEVTHAQYMAFLATYDGSSPPQPPQCSAWNTDLRPFASLGPNHPAIVNYCDAFVYCKWAGKRLCGGFPRADAGADAAPPPSPFDAAAADPQKSQWYYACTGGDPSTRPLPYGMTYVKGLCNDVNDDAGTTLPVGSKPLCEGGVPGLFDMAGNLSEWEDGCDSYAGGANARFDHCLVRGSPYNGGFPTMPCSWFYTNQQRSYPFGFRCCAP